MFDGDLHDADAAHVARLHAALDELASTELTGRSDGELLALMQLPRL